MREFEGKPLTTRETLIARKAYEDGLVRGSAREFSYEGGFADLRRAVECAFPLPERTRDPETQAWIDGNRPMAEQGIRTGGAHRRRNVNLWPECVCAIEHDGPCQDSRITS